MIANKSFSEKRRDPRIDSNIPLKICHEQGDIVTETGNISRSGAYCRVNRYIEPMMKMKIHLLLPMKNSSKATTKKISCQGVVVRTEPVNDSGDFNIAIFFNEISQKDASVLKDYVAEIAG